MLLEHVKNINFVDEELEAEFAEIRESIETILNELDGDLGMRPDGSGLKITIARYYTPKGRSIQAEGIKPDIVVQERLVPEGKEKRRPHFTEKDLKNHISAKPEEAEKEEKEDTVRRIRGVRVPGEESYDDIQDIVTKDNQALRALEILSSWEIFSKMKK